MRQIIGTHFVVDAGSVGFDGLGADSEMLRDFAAGSGKSAGRIWLFSFSTTTVPIDWHQITVGILRNSLVHPREVFRPAIRDVANCLIVVHNHPSEDPTPSDQDTSVTERLEQTAEMVGIPLIDHIVVGLIKRSVFRNGDPGIDGDLAFPRIHESKYPSAVTAEANEMMVVRRTGRCGEWHVDFQQVIVGK